MVPLSPPPRGAGGPDADRGAVAIVVAAFMIVAMGLAAIIVDLGFARDRDQVAQNAADAAALAAAQSLSAAANPLSPTVTERGAATAAAQAYASANGWTQPVTVTFDLARYVVDVRLGAESEPSFFAGAIGQRSATVAAAAAARWADVGAVSPCSVCIVGTLDQRANGDVFVTQGDVRVGGAVLVGPNSQLRDAAGSVYAGDLAGSDIKGTLSPAPLKQQVGPFTDPFAGLPTPPLGRRVRGSPTGACTQGTYTSVDGCSSFGAGVYVLTGRSDFTAVPVAAVRADGVLFYLTCSNGFRSTPCRPAQAGGSISTHGGPNLSVTIAPQSTGPWAGIGIFADRNNTAALDIQGGSLFAMSGSLYMKAGTLVHGGNPDVTIDGSVVVGNYSANGNPNPLTVSGDGTSPAPPPPLGGPVALVS